ncbi:MAG: hypothetical protein ACOCUS_03055, partial [Polyangiales bacterium]
MRPRPELTALLHPAWWGALALLVLNDHLLKGSGLLPAAVTGKLSDFAGPVVATVLVIAVLGCRTAAARGLCFVAVAAPFAAINVSPAAATAVEEITALAGVPWRIWSDPTDL